jgi:hypothetical protein
VIKGPARLTAVSKPCSLLGRDSGFVGSRVEETEARINRKYRNSTLAVEAARGFELDSAQTIAGGNLRARA